MRLKLLLASLTLAAAAAPAAAQDAAPAAAPDYASDASWLCLPGRVDACGRPLPTTALNPNGYGSNGAVRPDPDAPIDCFYVYPTVSRDQSANSDMVISAQEDAAAASQFARFGTVCRTFAPIYRQATLAALLGSVNGRGNPAETLALAYQDVLAAWRHYLQHRNQGRPFVLVGHSQGTIHLAQLLAREIEGKPEAERMVSALLIGFNIEVPEGRDVGGTFQRTPLCRTPGQTGCVVTYVSFRATNPPPAAGAMFGRSARPGMTVACTNPAALRGGSAPLDSYWLAGLATAATGSIPWSSEGPPPTPFLRTEGLVSAACVNRGPVGYLSVHVNADLSDARTDRIPGDVVIGGNLAPGWGLHTADMSLAMGDLIALVARQAESMRRR